MPTRGARRLRDGREVDIGCNDGVRKLCRCGRSRWAKCPHAWHFSFQWEGQHHRFSLERHVRKKLTKTEAEAEAERLRTAIRAGEFENTMQPVRQPTRNAREAAGLQGFQLRDLRHEPASRLEEAGVLTTDVSKLLGHRNLSTTTRYLNTTSRRLRLALLRVEQARARQAESLANSCKDAPDSAPHTDDADAPSMPGKSLIS
jgi:hypothetical protein